MLCGKFGLERVAGRLVPQTPAEGLSSPIGRDHPEDYVPSTRIILDTNVWSYLAGSTRVNEFSSAVRQGSLQILVAPSVVYESLYIPDAAARARVVRLQSSRKWQRLMPDAFSECAEILAEVRRVRPEWLRDEPDVRAFERQRRDWTRRLAGGGFWNRLRDDPAAMAAAIDDPYLRIAQAETRATRKQIELQGNSNPGRLAEVRARWGHDVWREPWRLQAFTTFEQHIMQPDNPYRDWLQPFLKVHPSQIPMPLWLNFWLIQADMRAVPRQWLRWAFEYLQAYQKWSTGTPGDAQLASYLVEADYLVSSDKRLIELTNRVQAQAPFHVAQGHLVRAGDAAVEDLIAFCLARP